MKKSQEVCLILCLAYCNHFLQNTRQSSLHIKYFAIFANVKSFALHYLCLWFIKTATVYKANKSGLVMHKLVII